MLPVLLIGASSATAASTATPTWKPVYSTSFTNPLDTTTWARYNGVPVCCKTSRWSPSHLVVQGGVLNLENYRDPAFGGNWVSAGISMGRSLNQTYGKWEVRFRMDRAVGVGMCMGLWPAQGWPPEIDFAEESARYGDRTTMTGTLHYGAANNMVHSKLAGDFSQWHTAAVEWTPGKIVYRMDGKVWDTVTGPMVPDEPMHLIIQTHVGTNGSTGEMPAASVDGNVDLQLDSVRVYSR
jgi:beta-glucanase (GH16 family)